MFRRRKKCVTIRIHALNSNGQLHRQTKDASPANDLPGTAKNASETKDASLAKDIEVSRPVRVEKADAKKRNHERLAYLHKPTHQRENYPAVVDYGAQSGYRPGLDGQR
jgi:hypothetical protein